MNLVFFTLDLLQNYLFRKRRVTKATLINFFVDSLYFFVYVCRYIFDLLLKNILRNVYIFRSIYIMTNIDSHSSTPLVTVITASFCLIKNGRKNALAQNIQSVQNQTYKNIEHLVIDGASTDGTIELLNQYRQKGMINYYSEPDNGIYDAMNKGILKAKGKYVVCLNSDDFYCSPYAVEHLVAKAESENADAAYSNARRIRPENQELIKRWCGSDHFSPWKSYFPCHQTFLIKTDVMKELGLYDLDYKVSADNNFLLRMVVHNKKFAYVNEDLVSFRDGGFSSDHAQTGRHDRLVGLYTEFGKNYGLTLEDCGYLLDNRFLSLPSEKAVQLGHKLKRPEWVADYFHLLTKHLSPNKNKDAATQPSQPVKKNNQLNKSNCLIKNESKGRD